MLSSSPLYLRDAIPFDLEAMHRLDQLCFAEPFRFDQLTMRRYASEAGAIVLLAYARPTGDSELLGLVLVNLVHRRTISLAYVTTLDVHPDHRRQGIAATLMREAEIRAAATNAFVLRLHVSVVNLEAVRFYEQLGFTRHSHLPNFYGNGLDSYVYSKPLS